MKPDSLNMLGVGVLSIRNLKISSSKLGGRILKLIEPVFWIFIELIHDLVHLGWGLEVSVAVKAMFWLEMWGNAKVMRKMSPPPSLNPVHSAAG